MKRTIRRATVTAVLAAAAAVSIPATASADASIPGPAPVISCDGNCQIAAGSIFNAGRDNIVRSGDIGEFPGPGTPAPTTLITVVNFSPYELARYSQTGVGDYPQLLHTRLAQRFRVEGPSEARYAGGPQAEARLQIMVNQQGDVSCGGSGLICEAFHAHDGVYLAIS